MDTTDEIYNIGKAAHFLGISPKQLRRLTEQRFIETIFSTGGHRRYKKSVLNKFKRLLARHRRDKMLNSLIQ